MIYCFCIKSNLLGYEQWFTPKRVSELQFLDDVASIQNIYEDRLEDGNSVIWIYRQDKKLLCSRVWRPVMYIDKEGVFDLELKRYVL